MENKITIREEIFNLKYRRAELLALPIEGQDAESIMRETSEQITEIDFRIQMLEKNHHLLEEERDLQLRAAARAIKREAFNTAAEWPVFHSFHEGFGVLQEEVDELWAEMKVKTPNLQRIRQEAIHVGAMALRIAGELAPLEIPE